MGKILRRVLIPLVIVVALVALLDRVANAVAERQVASQVADTAADHGAYSDQRPDVTIHGWPFVTQVFGGELEQIDITLSDVGADGLVFPELDLVASDIEADWRELADGTGRITAATVDAEGSIALDSLSSLVDDFVDIDATVEDDGTVRLEATAEVEGIRFDLVTEGRIALAGNALEIVTGEFELADGGALPPQGEALLEEYTSQLNTTLDLPELPYGIELTEISFSDGTMEVAGSATDVDLT
ncbi:LmeA family phospholipid-binding protein [Glycomyces salinus]|uniref:LmeA family phospholipid-binding protein n=1 Tax=Glycomyces salinus TaxID=980294 RepID=UPI0018EC07F5|nr:DUF2993 domain-containing protein [Glycomyces salinus]